MLGTVEAIAADGEVRRLERGDSVFEGDTLRSGPSGRAQIRFTDRGMVSLRPDTELALDEYNDDAAAPAANRKQMSLSRGGFRTRTGNIARVNREGYRVQSPVAAIGIRGTVFEAHQEPGGALLVGVTEGTLEVETITGEIGRIGEGEGFNYLRVNTDGSIEYLLEAPEAFTASPGLDEGDDDEPLDVGDSARSSITTGSGAAESTAGLETLAGDALLGLANDPEGTGIVSRARVGSGDPPTVTPIDEPPVDEDPPVLSQEQIDLLLADDRLGVALDVPTVTVGEDGELQVGAGTLQAGIATFNSPMLVLSSDRGGLTPGLATSQRSDILEEADLFLVPDSAESESEQDVGGAPGLVWGRYLAPVSLFLDPEDRDQLLELERDVLFVLGTPTDIAVREGAISFELADFLADSGGLTIADMDASAALDFDAALLFGFLDVLFGEEGIDAEIAVDYAAQVEAGVLADIEILFIEFLDIATDEVSTVDATLAGFFTGEAAAFLQLAFDLRVDGRADADVTGLALLTEVDEITGGALTPEEFFALQEGFVFVAVNCCVEDGGFATGTFAGRALDPRPSEGDAGLLAVVVDPDGVPVAVSDPDFAALRTDQVIRRDGAQTVFFDADEASSLAAFEWRGLEAPARAFDAVEGDPIRDFERNLIVQTGLPTRIADLTGWVRYELDELYGFYDDEGSFLERTAIPTADMSFNVDFADGAVTDGVFSAPFDLFAAMEGEEIDPDPDFFTGSIRATFTGQLNLDGDRAFVDFEVSEGELVFGEALPDPVDVERSSMDGFFSGDDGDAFAGAFHFQTVGENFLDEDPVPLLAFGVAFLERQNLALTDAEASQLDIDRFGFTGAACCTPGAGGALVGIATDDPEGDPVLGITPGSRPGDDDFTFADFLLRRGGAGIGFVESDDVFDAPEFLGAAPTNVVWTGSRSRPLLVDAVSGDILERLDDFLLFQTALPSDIADLVGFATFAGDISGFRAADATARHIGFSDQSTIFSRGASASFNVDLDSGEIYAGHLFAVEDFLDSDGIEAEIGVEVFFSGQVMIEDDSPFAVIDVLDGSFEGRAPLDVSESGMEGFFSGSDGLIFSGSYHLVSDEDEPMVAGGIFAISDRLLPETRLTAEDVAAWVREGPEGEIRPGFAIASFGVLNQPENLLLLGRGGPVEFGGDFVLAANTLHVFEDGVRVADTRRRDFWAQPFDFVLRQEGLFDQPAPEIPELFDDDARPDGAPSFEGFEVSWGAWSDAGADAPPSVRNDPEDPDAGFSVGREAYFASVNPTPTSQLPRQGMAAYGGPAAFIGGGRGDLSTFQQGRLDDVRVEFLLDFGSGVISEGMIDVEYSGVAWSGRFEGQLNAAITDLMLTELTVTDGGPVFEADLDVSSMTGMLTGPEGQRHAGGFNFFLEDFDGELLETAEGLWVIDQLD